MVLDSIQGGNFDFSPGIIGVDAAGGVQVGHLTIVYEGDTAQPVEDSLGAVVQVTTPAVGDEQTQDNPHVSR